MEVIIVVVGIIGKLVKGIAKVIWILVKPIWDFLYQKAIEVIGKRGVSESGAKAIISAIIIVAIIGILAIL